MALWVKEVVSVRPNGEIRVTKIATDPFEEAERYKQGTHRVEDRMSNEILTKALFNSI